MTPLYKLLAVKDGALEYSKMEPCSNADSAVKLLAEFFKDAAKESFVVLALDVKNRPIGLNVVSAGTLTQSLVHPREVFQYVILANAAGFILSHNHPSGDPTPSSDDDVVTKRLRACAEVLGFKMVDHIIVGEDKKYFSYALHGWG